MFPNVLTFSVTINGRELDVSQIQPVLDRLTGAILASDEDPLLTLERLIRASELTARELADVKRKAARKAKREATGEAIAEAVGTVAREVIADIPRAAAGLVPVLSRKRGS